MKTTETLFDKRVKQVREEMNRLHVAILAHQSGDTYYGNKQSAAVKRASMDLTRALAQLRKGNVE